MPRKMILNEGPLEGLLIIEPKVLGDDRGFFFEVFQEEVYKNIGVEHTFVQDNFSTSCRNVLRGLHFQRTKPQGKLVTCSHEDHTQP